MEAISRSMNRKLNFTANSVIAMVSYQYLQIITPRVAENKSFMVIFMDFISSILIIEGNGSQDVIIPIKNPKNESVDYFQNLTTS